MTFEFDGKQLKIQFSTYENNGRLAVQIVTMEGEPYATLSTNVNRIELQDKEFVAKTYSENVEIAEACKHLFEDTGLTVQTGYVHSPIWKVK